MVKVNKGFVVKDSKSLLVCQSRKDPQQAYS